VGNIKDLTWVRTAESFETEWIVIVARGRGGGFLVRAISGIGITRAVNLALIQVHACLRRTGSADSRDAHVVD